MGRTDPSIGTLGRLHFSRSRLQQLRKRCALCAQFGHTADRRLRGLGATWKDWKYIVARANARASPAHLLQSVLEGSLQQSLSVGPGDDCLLIRTGNRYSGGVVGERKSVPFALP